MSTTAICKKHENYLRHIFYRENTFWTDGYFVSSVQNVSQKTIKKYIENQG
ncbi:transposase [Parabacteroides merdae]|nr:transposase [Parabacteroides merdae]MCE8889151.1 transposase [Parabacteroides merdae]